MNIENLIALINSKPELSFGDIFNKTFELFKKVWVQGFVVLLLTFAAILPFYIILYIPMIAAGITDPESFAENEMPPMVALGMGILAPVFMLGVTTFALALNASFLKICKQKDQDEMATDDYFYFFKEGRLGKSFKLALYTLGLSIVGMLACGVGLIYVSVPIALIPAFMAFNEQLNAFDTIKACFALGNKNWIVIFGLIFVLGLIAQFGGMLLCCIGVLFTAMLSKVPVYYFYKDGVGFEEEVKTVE